MDGLRTLCMRSARVEAATLQGLWHLHPSVASGHAERAEARPDSLGRLGVSGSRDSVASAPPARDWHSDCEAARATPAGRHRRFKGGELVSISHPSSALDGRLLVTAAALSISAGMAHGTVTQEHFAEWWGYGVFFSAATVVQLAYGLMLISLPAWSVRRQGLRHALGQRVGSVYLLGIVGNLSLIVLWAVTRTLGVPLFGPAAGEVEAVTTVSLVSKLLELLVVGCLTMLLVRARSRSRPAAGRLG